MKDKRKSVTFSQDGYKERESKLIRYKLIFKSLIISQLILLN